jgi:hypothetical protein
MATFIPEWAQASGRDLHIRRALAGLDDEHVIRRPLRQAGGCPAAVFVQHAARGWLALGWCADPFAALDPAQLFESEPRRALAEALDRLQELGSEAGSTGPGTAALSVLVVLVVLWGCTDDEVQLLQREHAARRGLRLVSREQFRDRGAEIVSGLLAPLPGAAAERLLARYFPEAEIAAVCTARRFARRDNAARLTRYFLDAQQEWATKLDLDLGLHRLPAAQCEAANDFSVRLVNGVAGSGKTLIALQRARLMAELFPRQRILVLIHNTPVVADIKDRLRRAGRGLPPNVDFMTVFAWLVEQWQRAFGSRPTLPTDPDEVAALVRFHRRRWPGLKASDAQLVAELDFIDDHLIVDEAGYAAASRSGRGFALRAAERGQVWALYAAVTKSLRAAGLLRWSALPRILCLARDRHGLLQRYDHILLDEAQFCVPSWFQAVKLSLAERGQLFLCADPNQGFMKSGLSWRSAGLDVAGRTKRLRRSYRSTAHILGAATSVLQLLEERDPDDYLAPDFTGMDAGRPPQLLYADTPQDAVDRLVNEVAALAGEAGIPLDAFLVIYGRNVNKAALYWGLRRRFGARCVWWFNEHSQKKAPPRRDGGTCLRLANLDTATGLEAGIVLLVGVEGLLGLDVAPAGHAAEREDQLRKLYMAMTRAGQHLVLLSCQRLPAPLECLFEQA